MLETLAVLLAFQLVGEALTFAVNLPIPGPVIGMVLLLASLTFNEKAAPRLRETSLTLLRQLSLLYVPAGVGVMLHVSRLAEEWWPIAAALVVSTALSISVTALVVHWLSRKLDGDEQVQ